ncbi:hypothetical protein GCM10022222_85470 [Amycolatopsis ultiminotia]|uniref:Uncharacterized protein n=1 Tax=Amycolatopsis ultiminotia TaxID=543629 RepID=A0ABP6YP60_9PSEU
MLFYADPGRPGVPLRNTRTRTRRAAAGFGQPEQVPTAAESGSPGDGRERGRDELDALLTSTVAYGVADEVIGGPAGAPESGTPA